jgi:acetyl esterase/lipase
MLQAWIPRPPLKAHRLSRTIRQRDLVRLKAITWLPLVVIGLLALPGTASVTPPTQPATGPGSSAYTHATVDVRMVRSGGRGWWLFLPESPKPTSAPVIVFCHGWGAMQPGGYRAWIDHLVRRGNIVIFPIYQDNLFSRPETFLPNAIAAVKDAITQSLEVTGRVHSAQFALRRSRFAGAEHRQMPILFTPA